MTLRHRIGWSALAAVIVVAMLSLASTLSVEESAEERPGPYVAYLSRTYVAPWLGQEAESVASVWWLPGRLNDVAVGGQLFSCSVPPPVGIW
jgi:hypothetical protein